MDKEELKKLICELIDRCDSVNLDFYKGQYSNIYEKGIVFTLEGSFEISKNNEH